MDLNLKDLGATLVTGSYFLLGCFVLLCLIFGWHFFFFLHLARRVSSGALTLLTLSVAFGAGMLLEDISNKFVDSGTVTVPILDCRLLPLDEELRVETLFNKEFIAALPSEEDLETARRTGKKFVPPPTNDGKPPELSRLSRRAADLGLLAKHGGPTDGATIQQIVLSNDPTKDAIVSREQFSRVASRLYYDAKNTAYTIDNHYDELRQIQTRIDFSRSFALLSLTLAFIGVCLAVIALIFPRLGMGIAKRFDRRSDRAKQPLTRSKIIARAIPLTSVLVLIFFLGRFAYMSEEVEFDKRAYGYFFTLSARSISAVASATEAAAQSKELRVNGATRAQGSPAIGYSGLVQINKATFLVVHDTKAEMTGPRLGTLLFQPGSTIMYAPIEVNWGAELPNDFEAVCAVPGQDNEFLVAESGYQEGRFGRIFHFALTKGADQWNVSVKGTIALPKDTDNIEGLACVVTKAKKLILLLGERGGSDQNPSGKIRWGTVDLVDYRFQMLGESKFAAPASIAGQKDARACADLYIDGQHRLWSVATQDRGDDGPFRSVIYQAGTIEPDGAEPVQLLAQTSAAWTCDGVKVEGLGPSPIENSPLSVVTDDENYEGIWRPLFPAR